MVCFVFHFYFRGLKPIAGHPNRIWVKNVTFFFKIFKWLYRGSLKLTCLRVSICQFLQKKDTFFWSAWKTCPESSVALIVARNGFLTKFYIDMIIRFFSQLIFFRQKFSLWKWKNIFRENFKIFIFSKEKSDFPLMIFGNFENFKIFSQK